MNSPDIRTLVFSFFITDLIINIVIVKLWLDNRKHFSGTFFWVMNFVFQTAALLLIGLRGTIPDWLSMVVSNALIISGNLLGLIGLKHFAGHKSSDIQNYILLVLFIIIHSWFALVKPDLPVRNLNLASAFLIISFQFCWLIFYRLKGEMRELTRNIGIIFIFYSLVNIGRIVNFFTAPHPGNDYFKPNGFESFVLILYQMLFILLTYTLALMFNRRLLNNIDKGAASLRESQALLQAAMDYSPTGIAIADAPDGKLRYVNKAGLMIPAKSADEIVKDIDINKYVASWHIKHHDGTPFMPDEVPLARAILYGETNSREFIITRDDNENRVVLANAAPILDDSGKVMAGIVVFQDITDYKKTENLLNDKIQELEDARTASLNLIHELNLEIEKRKSAELAIRKTEKYFRFLIDNAPDGVVLVNSVGKMTYASPSARTMFGYNDSFVELPDPNESTHPDDLPMVLATIQDLIKNPGMVKTIKYRFRNSNGNWLWVESTFANHFTDEGIEALVINFRDITASKIAEDSIIESEEKFRNLFEHSPVGKSMTGIDGSINVNKAFCTTLGYTSHELRSKSWKDISHPGDISMNEKLVKKLINGKSDFARFEKRYIHKNGSTVFTDVATYLQRDKNNNPQYFITTINDITARKLIETESFRLQDIINSSLNEIYIFDSVKLNFEYLNRGALKNIGYSLEEIRLLTPVDIKPEFTIAKFKKMVNPLLSGERETIIFETVHKRKNGTIYPVEVHLQFYNKDGAGLFLAVINDITERKKSESEILKLNAELEERVIQRTVQLREANSELEAFSYSVSHDLRAPLRAIHSFTSILREDYKGVLGEEGKRICSIIESSSVHMGQLIDDLLAFSRISRTEIRFAKIDMTRMVESILEELSGVEDKKKIIFKLKKLPAAYGDSSTIRQVFINLISNAIKYSSKNETPEVTIGCERNNNNSGNVYFVRDNGVGFDMQFADKLFRVFQRLHSIKEFEGNGVGLAIVHRIISRHGGKIWAEAEIGKGATFFFMLPDKDK